MEREMSFPFEFSVIMAVYNVEPFLKEAVDSLIAQDFGFENIQLIMVDDGATDGSGAICDEYAVQYPENVVVIHKENGGVSSARNEGLKHATGRYVNFLDSDDKFSQDAFSKVYKIFSKYDNETDVAAVSRRYFEGRSGEHNLNYRFKKGSKVIDLRKDYTAIQNTTNSAFFKAEIAKSIRFDERLRYCEDTKYVCLALLPKMKIAVVSGCTYFSRKRVSGAASATQVMDYDKRFFVDPMKYLTIEVIRYCINLLGYVPRFIQFTLMYELQYKLIAPCFPKENFSEAEINEYERDLHNVFQYFNDDIILSQKNMYIEYKIDCLRRKYGCEPDFYLRENDVLAHYNNLDVFYWSNSRCVFDFLTISDGKLHGEGYIASNFHIDDINIFLCVNENYIECKRIERNNKKYSLNRLVRTTYGFSFDVDLNETKVYSIKVCSQVYGQVVVMKNIIFDKFSSLTNQLKTSFVYKNRWKLHFKANLIIVEPCGRYGLICSELKLWRELWKLKEVGSRKAILARAIYRFLSLLKRKELWIITDRVNKGDDNGQAFWEYMSNIPHSGINCYFAINKSSADYFEIRKFGKAITPLSWKYKTLFLLSDKIISSNADDSILKPFQNYCYYYQDLVHHKFVFLQHGVTKDDLSRWLNKYNMNISLLVTTTMPEYRSVVDGNYFYTPNEVKLTGLPRYDRLYCEEKRRITIMPSWRGYLVTGMDAGTGLRNLKPGFGKSKYYDMYQALFNHRQLFEMAQKLGYTIQYMGHPNMTASLKEFQFNNQIEILPLEKSYREIFAESNLIITDYSSVAFDFAYLRKPVIYYQADKEEFFSGEHTYEKGYFDYEQDGFGEVEYSVDALAERIIEYMQSGCQMKEKYRKRIDATFPFSDRNNCRRVYEEILKLDKRE